MRRGLPAGVVAMATFLGFAWGCVVGLAVNVAT